MVSKVWLMRWVMIAISSAPTRTSNAIASSTASGRPSVATSAAR